MRIHADLHAHSVFAGGTGSGTMERRKEILKKRLEETVVFSSLKGITHLGTGDIQFEPYLEYLEKNLEESSPGFFQTHKVVEQEKYIPNRLELEPIKFVLQTEIIFTSQLNGTKKRKKSHVLFLFPNFEVVRSFNLLMDKWGVARRKIARPFVVCKDTSEVSDRINSILDIHSDIEVIPAHVMTPEGVFGGATHVNSLGEFFGESAERIHAVETGLSADPAILGLIPELDSMTLISNADAHSAGLNKVGREFTTLELNLDSYSSLISSIRKNKVISTAEFHPSEGRYFLTGHREKRKKPYRHENNQYCFFSPRHVPRENKCPICHKNLTIGVLQRAYEISKFQGGNRVIGEGPSRSYVTVVPLIEIIALSKGIKSVSSKAVLREYFQICDIVGSEVNLWTDSRSHQALEEANVSSDLIDIIKKISRGLFYFDPPGYDGVYGKLKVGERPDIEDISVISF